MRMQGNTLLVAGGTSGIGTTAIQLAKAFGAKVFVTVGSAEKCAAATKLGADLAIDYNTQDFVAEVKSATGGKGVDVILDMVGGSYVARNYEAAAVDGRIVQIAFQQGSKVQIDFMRVMLKRLTHTGSTLRSRPVADKALIAAALEELGLVFLGFEVEPGVEAAFHALNPGPTDRYDLTRWAAFEEAHPDCFIGMYQFFAQK
eukprot:gene48059-58871_t